MTDWSIRLTREAQPCGRQQCVRLVPPGLALFADEDGRRRAVCVECGQRAAPAMVELLLLREVLIARANRDPAGRSLSIHETRPLVGQGARLRA